MRKRPKVLLVMRAVIHRDEKILLIKRSKDESWDPSRWEIPGGKLDIGQSIPEVVRREIKEETGLDIKVESGKVLTFTETEVAKLVKYKGYHLLTLVFEVKNFSGKLRLSPEHDDSRWATLKEALDLKLTETTRKILSFLAKRTEKI